MFIDEANHIYIDMLMYNLIEYRDNYSDRSGSLSQFKRDEPPANNADWLLIIMVFLIPNHLNIKQFL